jgi:hypothetical protein
LSARRWSVSIADCPRRSLNANLRLSALPDTVRAQSAAPLHLDTVLRGQPVTELVVSDLLNLMTFRGFLEGRLYAVLRARGGDPRWNMLMDIRIRSRAGRCRAMVGRASIDMAHRRRRTVNTVSASNAKSAYIAGSVAACWVSTSARWSRNRE